MSAAWPHGDPRDVARSVLADPRFHLAAETPSRPWWSWLLDELGKWWNRLWEPLVNAVGNQWLARAIGIGILVIVLAFLVYVIVRFARRVRIRRAERAPVTTTALAAEGDARTLFALALAAAAEGRHHDAAALLWSSALRALDERGRIRYDAARTPGEWRRAVRDPAFDALARDAVIALFGDHGADALLVARMRDAYDRVLTPA
jgi:Na+-transporting methylmalonyl-CoA/oxaloacetate decarboxylase gamma subunit